MSKEESAESKKKRTAPVVKVSTYIVDTKEMYNGTRTPDEFCDLLQTMKSWLKKSEQSNVTLC